MQITTMAIIVMVTATDAMAMASNMAMGIMVVMRNHKQTKSRPYHTRKNKSANIDCYE